MLLARLKRPAVRPIGDRLDADKALPVIRRVIVDHIGRVGIPHDGLSVAARDERDGAFQSRVQNRELVLGRLQHCKDVVVLFRDGDVTRLDTLGGLRPRRVDVGAAVKPAHRRAVAVPEEKVRMKPAAEAEGLRTRVRRRQLQVELHRHRDLELEVEVMRPELLRLLVRLESQRQLGHLLGVLRATHLEHHLARETMLRQVLREAVAKLRPADGNAAMHPVTAVVVALRGTEQHLGMARRTIGEHIPAQERNLRRPVLAREHRNWIPRKSVAENNPPRRPEPRIQLFTRHRPNLLTSS